MSQTHNKRAHHEAADGEIMISNSSGSRKKPKTSDPPGDQQAVNPSRFLALPSELRNRVYYFTTCPKDLSDPEGWKGSKNAIRQKDALALAHVCQQIRAEYKPLFMRAMNVKTNLTDLAKFIDVFYPNSDDFENIPEMLFVMLDKITQSNRHVRFEGIDILPLLKMRFYGTSVCVQFLTDDSDTKREESEKSSENDFLNSFIAFRSSTWDQDLEDGAIDTVNLCRSQLPSQRAFLHIQFRHNRVPSSHPPWPIFKDYGPCMDAWEMQSLISRKDVIMVGVAPKR